VSYFFYARNSSAQVVDPPKDIKSARWTFTKPQIALLVIAFLSGFYLITLETVLIRLMGMSTGSSNYNFTLIVAIFIFALGIGSLLAKNIAGYGSARLYWNQVGVVFFLFLLYLTGDYWSYGVHIARSMLRDIPQAFYFYQGVLGAGFLALHIVPIGLAGLTLPLCFHLIKDTKESLGERVGQLYGLNTVGCVLGALVGGYMLLNFIDLDQLFKVCIFMSIVSFGAAAYLYFSAHQATRMTLTVSSGVVAMVFFGLFFAPRWTRERFVQPFRHSQPTQATFEGPKAFGEFLARTTEFLFWKDGPNTSVGIGASKYQGRELSRTIFVNGKSDGNTRGDFFTTVILAHLPALLTEKIERVCVVGLGTGITIGTIKEYPGVSSIDVAEISNFSIENAHYFDPYNRGVSRDPKVKFHEMDAFRLLQGTKATWDVIISEPSNPWVAGIENLYSEEFYEIARNKMAENGMFVQWIHTYSFTDELLRMVLRTMSSKFSYVAVYQLKGGDLALVAKRHPITAADIHRGADRMNQAPIIREMLAESGINRMEDLLALEIVPSGMIAALSEGAGLHNLESPKLSNEAAKAFFVGSSSRIQTSRRNFKEYFQSLGGSLLSLYLGGKALEPQAVESLVSAYCDNPVGRNGYLCEETLALKKFQAAAFQVPYDRYSDIIGNTRELASMDAFHAPAAKRFGASDLQNVYTMFEMYKRFASPIAQIPLDRFLVPVDHCLKTTPYAEELFGECLLQKILVMDTATPSVPEFSAEINRYLDWFEKLPKTSTNYEKLSEAKNILVKMASAKR